MKSLPHFMGENFAGNRDREIRILGVQHANDK